MTPAERQAWIVRWLLLWTMGTHTPRVCAKDSGGMPWAYQLHGYDAATLPGDLARLRADGLLEARRLGRRTVYWLVDPKAAKAWAAQQPESVIT